MSDQGDKGHEPDTTSPDGDDAAELRESAKEMGVEDADERDPDEVVEEVRSTAADSETSPSEWRQKRQD